MIPATLPNDNLNLRDPFVFDGEGSGLVFAGIFVKESVATIAVDSDNADTIVTQFTTNGLSNNCTPDAANDKITITKRGKYLVLWNLVADLDVGVSVDVKVSAYLGGVITDVHMHCLVAAIAKSAMSSSGFVDVTAVPADLDLRANISSPTARVLTISDAMLNVVQVGGT